MGKSTKIGIAVVAVAVLAVFGAIISGNSAREKGISGYSEWEYIEGNEYNGNIADHYIGNKDAKVKVIEYADYQCSACAIVYPYLHEVVEEYGDKIALIFRTYVLSYHQNGTAAATAANAAGLQGYWEEYANLLFVNQNEWAESEGTDRDDLLSGYLETASEGKADLEKFREDMKSSAIKDKISFDRSLGNRINLSATPTIFINKEKYDIKSTKESEIKASLKEMIDAALEKE